MIRVILEGLVKRFGTIAAVDGASLELRPGEITYVSGPGRRGQDDAGSPGHRARSRRTMARFISVIGWCRRCRPTNAKSAWSFRTLGSGPV